MPVYMKPTSVIKANLGIQPGGKVQKFFTNECYKEMDRYVPYDKGNLRSVVSMDINGTYITYEMPYAEYQYYGIRGDGTHKVEHYTTPGTGPYWDKKMWTAKGNDIIRRTQNYIGGK